MGGGGLKTQNFLNELLFQKFQLVKCIFATKLSSLKIFLIHAYFTICI